MKVSALSVNYIFKKKKKTLAAAESCTGGLVSHLITAIPGSSAFFRGAVVAYSNHVKVSVLGVPETILKKHGAVSREVARSMAAGARLALESDVAVSATGIAGPSGGTKDKPVGLAYIAVATPNKVISRKVFFKGDREELKKKFADAVLRLVSEAVQVKTIDHRPKTRIRG